MGVIRFRTYPVVTGSVEKTYSFTFEEFGASGVTEINSQTIFTHVSDDDLSVQRSPYTDVDLKWVAPRRLLAGHRYGKMAIIEQALYEEALGPAGGNVYVPPRL